MSETMDIVQTTDTKYTADKVNTRNSLDIIHQKTTLQANAYKLRMINLPPKRIENYGLKLFGFEKSITYWT